MLQKMLLWQASQRRDGGKLLVRTKKHENVLSLQMYQFTFIRYRLHQFLPCSISFLPLFFFTTLISHLIITHKTPLSAVSAIREEKSPIKKKKFFLLIQRSFFSS